MNSLDVFRTSCRLHGGVSMSRVFVGLAQAAVCGITLGLTLFTCAYIAKPKVAQAGSSVQDVVQARSFQVLDSQGSVRASMSVDRDGNPYVSLLDSREK